MVQGHPHIFKPTRATGCQAFAYGTGRQCNSSRTRAGERYCSARGHLNQKGKCRAMKRNNKRCLVPMSEGGRGFFCEEHEDWATINETACAGYKTDGTKCYRRVPDPQYPYCRTSHDPRVEYVDPQLFRLNGLRYQVLGTLVKRDGRDLYDPKRKIKKATSNDEVEHIGELQQVSFLLQFASFEDKEEQDDVVVFFRDDVVNQLSNLCLTSKDINARKCAAVTHSLEDIVKFSMAEYDQLDPKALHDIRASAFNVPIVATFTDRLRDEGLKRASTKAIRREMRPALRSWWYKCRDQGESPIYEQIGQSARQLCTILDLADGLGVD